jgi:hypothetical protein
VGLLELLGLLVVGSAVAGGCGVAGVAGGWIRIWSKAARMPSLGIWLGTGVRVHDGRELWGTEKAWEQVVGRGRELAGVQQISVASCPLDKTQQVPAAGWGWQGSNQSYGCA